MAPNEELSTGSTGSSASPTPVNRWFGLVNPSKTSRKRFELPPARLLSKLGNIGPSGSPGSSASPTPVNRWAWPVNPSKASRKTFEAPPKRLLIKP